VTKLAIRTATVEDSECVFVWRNDPDTRAASLNNQEVLWSQHEPWFEAALTNRRIALYLIATLEAPHERVAMCRFNISPSGLSSMISINLNPDFRGQGLATSVVKLAMGSFTVAEPDVREVVAIIWAQNVASRRIFDASGFAEIEEQDGVITAVWKHAD
jgi:RimJ/RimL family protein N-acetyltransferase